MGEVAEFCARIRAARPSAEAPHPDFVVRGIALFDRPLLWSERAMNRSEYSARSAARARLEPRPARERSSTAPELLRRGL